MVETFTHSYFFGGKDSMNLVQVSDKWVRWGLKWAKPSALKHDSGLRQQIGAVINEENSRYDEPDLTIIVITT